MSIKLIISKIGNKYHINVNDLPETFSRYTSNLLTSGGMGGIVADIGTNGIFTNEATPVSFYFGGICHRISFEESLFPDGFDNPAEEIKRRVKLVRDAFPNKKVWQVEIESSVTDTEKT